ncbi:hypothetical protein [Hymenobacter weizhouensis]|uniref:hypothetical protein n=1 Tax=Hymenobacter sp. YIM 151500-1 TaxID=2987689 RepID=UPI0022270407|nr:hypothetical protein [Hymenobacter sp. YIM 151500-1]UYZ62845.1 hypothetical protein OIS53_17835 [Hymenobacter sp. YIM 151500-1]
MKFVSYAGRAASWPGLWGLIRIGAGVGGVLLAGCSPDASRDKPAVALPTGHYEGPVTYQGTELRVALDLRETQPGQLTATISFPQLPGLEIAATDVRYQEPQLRLAQEPGQAGGVSVQAIREGDFLRGAFAWDSIRTDFVWVRRGPAPELGFREQPLTLQLPGGAQTAALLIPDDTLTRHPAVAFLPTGVAAARQRAVYLARRGFATLLLPGPVVAADSAAAHLTAAALAGLRQHPAVDSARVGVWVRGALAAQVATAAAQAQPAAAFVLLEGAPANTPAEAQPFQVLARRRVPVLGLYAGLDTTVRLRESSRRLRSAVGYRRHTQVRTFSRATADFLQPGHIGPNGQWQWPQPAPGYWEGLEAWLRQL